MTIAIIVADAASECPDGNEPPLTCTNGSGGLGRS
jgi:hypothetical protein